MIDYADLMKQYRNEAISDIVEYKGKHCYIDSCNTLDAGYETMIFSCDEKGNVTDWSGLYTEHYCTEMEMIDAHKAIVADISSVLD